MDQKRVLILGSGKIGSLIGSFLSHLPDYQVAIIDLHLPTEKPPEQAKVQYFQLDASDKLALDDHLAKHPYQAVLSALPFYCNVAVAEAAQKYHLHYFDLTEDVAVTEAIRGIANGAPTAFVPQCGLAPGFISIVTQDLMTRFEAVDSVKMRVGALPVQPSNALKYSLTWSTDGLINEYGNLCYGILNGAKTALLPLEGYETIELDGLLYEAFNTSGGLGTLVDTYDGQVVNMDYKTLRYPGHCEKIRLLMNDLKLNQDRETLKRILERAIPKTLQDVVLIYVSVSGTQKGDFFEETYSKKIYPHTLWGKGWSAIQISTAAGICGIMDLVLQNPEQHHGFITQESFSLPSFLEGRFGTYYR